MQTIYQEQTKNTKIKKTGDTQYISQNELDKACFQHDMADGDFKDLHRRTVSDKVLRDIAKSSKYDAYQRDLINFMVYNFFNKKSALLARSDTLVAKATRDKCVSVGDIKMKICPIKN